MKSSQAYPEDVPLVREGEQLQDSDGFRLLFLFLFIILILLWRRQRLELIVDAPVFMDHSISCNVVDIANQWSINYKAIFHLRSNVSSSKDMKRYQSFMMLVPSKPRFPLTNGDL